MKKKEFILSTLLILLLATGSGYGGGKFSYGLKGGINFNRFIYFNDISIHDYGYPQYSYPVGFNGNIFTETQLSNSMFLHTGISILYNHSKVKLAIGQAESNVSNNLKTLLLHFPFQIKLNTGFPFAHYLILGPELGYLINAKYVYTSYVGIGSGEINITKELPRVNASVAFAIGHNFKLFNQNQFLELKLLLGLSQYEYIDLGSWRNGSLLFGIGVLFP